MTDTTIGTSYFVSLRHAVEYYRYQYGPMKLKDLTDMVASKATAGDIHIGKPDIKDGESLVLLDEGRRYGIKFKA